MTTGLLVLLTVYGLHHAVTGVLGLLSKGAFLSYEVKALLALRVRYLGGKEVSLFERWFFVLGSLIGGSMMLVFGALGLTAALRSSDGVTFDNTNQQAYVLSVTSSIVPEPIVAREVIWHIELSAPVQALTNVDFYVQLPPEIKIVSGNPTWKGDLAKGERKEIDLSIVVISGGEWIVFAFAETTDQDFYAASQLHIISSQVSAKVTDALDLPIHDP